MHKSQDELDLHRATPPISAMADNSLYCRVQGKGFSSPTAKEKCLALLHDV